MNESALSLSAFENRLTAV